MEKISAICSATCAYVAFISLQDMEVYSTIFAALVAVVSGLISIHINLKNLKNLKK